MKSVSQLTHFEKLTDSLNKYISSSEVYNMPHNIQNVNEPLIYTPGLKLEIIEKQGQQRLHVIMHTNDHNPPHFHLHSEDSSQEARFTLNGDLITYITPKRFSKKIIQYIKSWCSNHEVKNRLKIAWRDQK